MHTVTINLPETFNVESRGVVIPVNSADLPDAIWETGAVAGIFKTLIDSASQAGTVAAREHFKDDKLAGSSEKAKAWLASSEGTERAQLHTDAIIRKRLEGMKRGDWGAVRSGEGLSDIRSLAILRLFTAIVPKDKKAAFNALSAGDKVRKALENEAAFGEEKIAAKIAQIEAERAERKAEKEELSKLSEKLSFDF